ncbi:zinc finger SWIM domain-containing protein 7-like [Corticium candelabrum]|uniref:zinc finger SWIM domain-containing protein 7-like n=1 Tax=Corticium candelabrum TaxID=121492 RepID=UPI002E271CD6|nr:zinc finger SWIM domain-containing protein 7-like [Corticium candelabrum]
MTFELSYAIQQLFIEAGREKQEHDKLSDGLLSALHCVFGQPLLYALDLVDRNKVTEYTCSSGRTAFTVTGSSGQSYVCLPTSNFCTCPSYVYTVLVKGDAAMCKHVLAMRLSRAMGCQVKKHISDNDLADLLCEGIDTSHCIIKETR